MPKIRRHRPGRYKEKSPKELQPNFTGVKPLTVFQDEYGKWGAKAGDGAIEISPAYELLSQSEEDKKLQRFKCKYKLKYTLSTGYGVCNFAGLQTL